MKRAALFFLGLSCAFAVQSIPSECSEIESFDPSKHTHNYRMLEDMRNRCQGALQNSPEAKARQAIALIELAEELDLAHQARLSPRLKVLERTREIVDRFRTLNADAFGKVPGSFFSQALEDLDAAERSADQLLDQLFSRYLSKSFDAILTVTPDARDETVALIHTISAKVATAAGRSDEQITALDSLMKEAIGTARTSIHRLRTGAALVADRTTLQELVDRASAELLEVQAQVAFARFATKAKVQSVLLQAIAAASAGARSSAQTRIEYLDRAYVAFWSSAPERLRAPLTSGPAVNFLRQLEAIRQLTRNLNDTESEKRLSSYIHLRTVEFQTYRTTCQARAGRNAPALVNLERDLASMSTSLDPLNDIGLRLFLQESIVERLEIARSMCKEPA